MLDTIRVALIQPKPYPSFDDPRNIGHALQLLDRCRGEKVDVICFPEYFPYQGERELAGTARQHNAYVIAGMVEAEGDSFYNTSTLFDRAGRLLGRQRKRHVTQLEREHMGITAGDGIYRAFATDFGKIGIPVGVDFWGQPDSAKQLAQQGVEIVFNSGFFPVLKGHWQTGALVRAFDNFMAVVGVNSADYNALFHERRVHHHGGGSFVIQPPKMLDKQDFRRWFKSLYDIEDWVQEKLDALEQVRIVEVYLGSVRRFREEFRGQFGLGGNG
jgi:predicted amidohydrolase